MRKAISLILALALCCALAVPSLAAENPVANLTPEAAAAYLGIMEDIKNLDDAFSSDFFKDEWRGLLIDIDNDGTEELVVRYVSKVKDSVSFFELLCDIWTIKNGEPVRLFHTSLGVYVADSPNRYLMLVESMGETWLSVYENNMTGDTRNQIWTLCQLSDGVYKAQHTFRIYTVALYNYDGNGRPAGFSGEVRVQHFIDGVEVSENEFTSRPIREIKRVLNCRNHADVQDESLPFEDLIASLQKQASGITITVNSKTVTWTDTAPFIDANDRTMVPLRAVADAMGLTVNWDADAREAIFSNGVKTIWFPIDSDTARTSDGSTVTMDTTAVIVNDRTYAPIRYLAEYFGYGVDWDAATRTVTITG